MNHVKDNITKEEFQAFSKPRPGPHHKFMTSLGFSLRQTFGDVATYSYTGSQEKQTPVGRSVQLTAPLWVTIYGDIMTIQSVDIFDKLEPFSETQIVQAVLAVREQKREWRFPELPTEYQAVEDEQIFAGGLNWDGDPEDCQPDRDVIPFDGRPGYYEDGIF